MASPIVSSARFAAEGNSRGEKEQPAGALANGQVEGLGGAGTGGMVTICCRARELAHQVGAMLAAMRDT